MLPSLLRPWKRQKMGDSRDTASMAANKDIGISIFLLKQGSVLSHPVALPIVRALLAQDDPQNDKRPGCLSKAIPMCFKMYRWGTETTISRNLRYEISKFLDLKRSIISKIKDEYRLITDIDFNTNGDRVDIFMPDQSKDEMPICMIQIGLRHQDFWNTAYQVFRHLEKIKWKKLKSKEHTHLRLGEVPFFVVVMTLGDPPRNAANTNNKGLWVKQGFFLCCPQHDAEEDIYDYQLILLHVSTKPLNDASMLFDKFLRVFNVVLRVRVFLMQT